ncbi:MAG: NAD(P)/FAD-dependent oxidoreductase [Firmicutes bacterium]|nr:NAD(P)/FAD-dependent oxidoreductase [Bacillota bacterium]
MNKIVIIGGGYAGILTAKKLAKKFKNDTTTSITIIDKNSFHTMLTELHEVAAGRVEEDSIRISFRKVFAGRRVRFVQDYIESVDRQQKKVFGRNGSYAYDYLVIAAGSRPTYLCIPGAEEYSLPLWSYDDAVRLREHILDRFRRAAVVTNRLERGRLLTFHIVGAGLTGVEMAGELAEYVPILCERFEIDREEVSLFNVDLVSRPVPTLPEKLSAKIKRRLEKMGVQLLLNTRVVAVGADYIDLSNGDRVSRQATGTVIWVAGIESAHITQKAGEVVTCAEGGRLDTDKYLRSIDDERLYVAGDNINYTPEGASEPVPQMVENCEQSAALVAQNIYVAITGKGQLKEYKPTFHGVMISIGGRYGVARVGRPGFMVNLPSFLAMFTKHFINIVYFVQVLGWNKVFSYLKHEFFTIRNKRSFVGGHLSNRTPSFLLVPLRLWLGGVWLFEGIMKIVGGWLRSPKLTGFFGGANAWYDSLLGKAADGINAATNAAAVNDAVTAATGAATPVVDAVTAATEAVTSLPDVVTAATEAVPAVVDAVTAATGVVPEAVASAGTVVMNWDILGLFKMLFVSGKPVLDSTIADYAFKLDIPILNWFLNTFVLPYDWVQVAMQTFVVAAEVLIGLALIAGLFTTPASVLALVLLFMFVSTTGLYLSSFWMLFAAIALLWGAGSIFGLDYYITPLLKKAWKRLGWVRRLYIYHD